MKLDNANPFDLKPNGWNSNKVTRDNLDRLKKSVSSLEMFKPIIVREHEGGLQVLGGFHRNEAAKELGLKEVPILNLGPLSDQKAKEISIIDNTRYGEDDADLLEQLINSMDTELISSAIPEIEAVEFPDVEDTIGAMEERTTPTLKDDDAKTLKFRFDDLDKADEIEDKLLIVAKENGFYFADGYANLSEALYHVLVRKPLDDTLANGGY